MMPRVQIRYLRVSQECRNAPGQPRGIFIEMLAVLVALVALVAVANAQVDGYVPPANSVDFLRATCSFSVPAGQPPASGTLIFEQQVCKPIFSSFGLTASG